MYASLTFEIPKVLTAHSDSADPAAALNAKWLVAECLASPSYYLTVK